MGKVSVLFIVALLSNVLVECLESNENTFEQLERIVENINRNVDEQGLAVVRTPDGSFSNIISSGSTSNTKFQDLSTFYVLEDQAQYLNTSVGDVTVTFFNVNLGLETFLASYDYDVAFLRFLRSTGHLEVNAGTSTVNLNGTITRRQDGTCSALLETARITRIGDFSASVTPKTAWNTIVAGLVGISRYLSQSDEPVFNNIISGQIKTPEFKEAFTRIACQSLV